MKIGAGLVVAAVLAGCSSSTSAPIRSTSAPRPCHAATKDQVRRIDDSGAPSLVPKSGVTIAIPDRVGFNALVAARVNRRGRPVGVWLIGSDGGDVVGVNRAGQQQNNFTPQAGSVVGRYVREVADGPQYGAVVACLEMP
jgi:hypothetical protein